MTLHHDVHGPEDAPVLVLSSSLGTSGAMWEPQLAALSERYRVITYDMRGHGASPAPPGPYDIADLGYDVIEILDAHGVQRASFCGISLGGMIGLWLARRLPERIDRLVACCTSAYLPPPDPWRERAETVCAAGSTEPIADAVVGRWLTPAFAAEHPGTRAWLRAMLTACDAAGYAACCGVIETLDLRVTLPSITLPTLVVAAAEDPSIPPHHGELIASAIPDARYELIEDAAHIATVQQPEAITNLIIDHLEAP
jgi:3-oxoadipate enol-lactonase